MALRWVIALFATSLLVSQTAMDIFASALVLMMLWIGFRWKEQNSTHSLLNSAGADWFFLAWFLIVFLGYAIGGFSGDLWYTQLLNFKWILVLYLLIAAIRYAPPTEKMISGFAIFFGLCSLYAIVVWFLGFDPIRPDIPLETLPDGTVRTGGFLYQPIVFAHLYQLPLCILFSSWLLKLRWKEKGQWILGLASALGAIAILLSFSRGVWISLSAAILVMTFLFSRRTAAAVFALGVFLMGSLYLIWPNFKERIQYALQGGDSERVWIWKANLQMFKDHPILGLGYGENVEALHEYFAKVGAPDGLLISHAHNQYLHMLSGTGAIGTLAYLAVMIYFLVLGVRLWYRIGARESFHKGLALGLVGAQIAFLAGGMTEANLEHAKMKYTLIFVWALTVWLAYEYRLLRERL